MRTLTLDELATTQASGCGAAIAGGVILGALGGAFRMGKMGVMLGMGAVAAAATGAVIGGIVGGIVANAACNQ